jgi:hypothetical protein
MKIEDVISDLKRNKEVFQSLFHSVKSENAHWSPEAGKWSFLQVACHLLDEEREDFRARISSLFRDPSLPFEPIDPEGWVESRYYSEQEYTSVCLGFLEERKRSIEWLEMNLDQDWNAFYDHPKFGPMSARFLLDNWLAHDYQHFNQWNRMRYKFLSQDGRDLRYAGGSL